VVTVEDSDEVLISKSDVEEGKLLMRELQNQLDELKISNEYQIRLKDMGFTEQMRDLTENFVNQIENLKILQAGLQADKDREIGRYSQELQTIKEQHTAELHEVETNFHKKLITQYDKFQELQQKNSRSQKQWEQLVREKQLEHTNSLQSLADELEARLRMKMADCERLVEEMRQQKAEYEEIRRQTEVDIDMEILNLHSRYDKKLKAAYEENLHYKGENSMMRKKFLSLQKEIDDAANEIQRLNNDHKRSQEIIKSLEKVAAQLKKDVQDRDTFIQDKERKVFELKKNNQELEKYKFVLDFKIKDLKKQIEPKEQDIADMHRHISGLNVELESYNGKNADVRKSVDSLKKQLEENRVTCQKLITEGRKAEKAVKDFKRDFEGVMQYFQADPQEFRVSIAKCCM
jgi:chromosome segregation ATPase